METFIGDYKGSIPPFPAKHQGELDNTSRVPDPRPTRRERGALLLLEVAIWEFPKIRGTLFCGLYNKHPTIWGTSTIL